MRAWEQQLQDNQKKLGKWHSTENQREMETNERDNTFRKKEKELEEARKTLEISNELIKLKEEDMCMRIGALDAKEKVSFFHFPLIYCRFMSSYVFFIFSFPLPN